MVNESHACLSGQVGMAFLNKDSAGLARKFCKKGRGNILCVELACECCGKYADMEIRTLRADAGDLGKPANERKNK